MFTVTLTASNPQLKKAIEKRLEANVPSAAVLKREWSNDATLWAFSEGVGGDMLPFIEEIKWTR